MTLDVTPWTDPLSRTPAILRAAVSGRPDAWLDSRHAPDVVTPREAVRHLAFCERESWIDRIQFVRDPENTAMPDGSPHVPLLNSMSFEELLDDFEGQRRERLAELAALNLTEVDLTKSWTDTEEEQHTETVGNLLATWVAHDLYHLGQIFKSFSAPYADAVGPYQRFLNLPQFH